MEFVDTHFHGGEYLKDYAEYCREAADEGVRKLVLCSGSLEESLCAADCAEENDAIYFAAGVHPHEAGAMCVDAAAFRIFAERRKFVAVGEIGLDFYYDTSERSVQQEVFASFLDLALELNVPALIHCRDKDDSFDAYDRTLELLTPFHAKGGRSLLHCFAGTRAYAEKFMELGALFGVGGMLTFKMADNIRDVISAIPAEHLVLETDAPYLAPVPFRGKPNHSRYIPLIARKLAWLKGISLEECAEITTRNASDFFHFQE